MNGWPPCWRRGLLALGMGTLAGARAFGLARGRLKIDAAASIRIRP